MITILLTTYNGERFLSEQLDSLFSQTVQDFVLIVQDDGSTDGTQKILETYRKRIPERIEIHQNKKILGPAYNFLDLMYRYRDGYLMLCDQDDVWLPHKIENTLKKMKSMEDIHGENTPILIHSDLTVVSQDLQVIFDSYFYMAGVDSIDSIKQMVLRNNVAGCTTMYNGALAQMLEEIPKNCVMHDFWLAQIAFCFGKVICLPESQILYRQHSKNTLGAHTVHGFRHKWHKLTHFNEIRQALFASYSQAGELLRLYGHMMQHEDRHILKTYAAMLTMGKWNRLKAMRKEGLFRKGFLRKLSQVAFG